MKLPNRRTTIPAAVLTALVVISSDSTDAAESQPSSEAQVIQQIQRYCDSSWRNANIPRTEWSDFTQQAFAELLTRVSRKDLATAILQSDSPQRRELNRTIWRIVKRWIRAVRYVSLGGCDCPDPATIDSRSNGAVDFEAVMQLAAGRLTPRQCRILRMFRDGQSIGQISQRLGIPARRVSDEKYRAIQRIRRSVS